MRFELGAECLSLAPAAAASPSARPAATAATRIVGSHVLLAVGRRPEHRRPRPGRRPASRTDERGYIVVDEQCRTSADGVWAVGDCNGRGAFTHTSWNDHEIVVANLFDDDPRRIGDRIPCYALFIDPALGRIGMNETRGARQRPQAAAREDADAARRPRARGRRDPGLHEGAGRCRQRSSLLGAAILGLNGDEVVHGLLDMMAAPSRRWLSASTSTFMKPCVSPASRARPTRCIGIFARISLRPLAFASASFIPMRPSGGSMNSA